MMQQWHFTLIMMAIAPPPRPSTDHVLTTTTTHLIYVNGKQLPVFYSTRASRPAAKACNGWATQSDEGNDVKMHSA